MKKNSRKESITISKDDLMSTLITYKKSLQAKKYQELENHILEYIPKIVSNYDKNNEDSLYATILLKVQMEIISFIASKIRNGDIDLEINMIDVYSKHINLIFPKINGWIVNEAELSRQERYFHMINTSKHLNLSIEKEFINKIWEDSIIETLSNYNGQDLFSKEIIKTFRNKLSYVDDELTRFLSIKHLSIR